MRRRYRAEQVRRAVGPLRAARAEPFLAADLIAGFPGETEEDFQATSGWPRALGFAKLHVFPFSPRPGTAAFRMGARVPERVRDERAAALLGLSGRLHERYGRRWEGREEAALLEEPAGEDWIGTTGNYLRVRVRGLYPPLAARGALVRVRLERAGDPGLAVHLPER